jgi:hypothetical protein
MEYMLSILEGLKRYFLNKLVWEINGFNHILYHALISHILLIHFLQLQPW